MTYNTPIHTHHSHTANAKPGNPNPHYSLTPKGYNAILQLQVESLLAAANILFVKNPTPAVLRESLTELQEAIRKSNSPRIPKPIADQRLYSLRYRLRAAAARMVGIIIRSLYHKKTTTRTIEHEIECIFELCFSANQELDEIPNYCSLEEENESV